MKKAIAPAMLILLAAACSRSEPTPTPADAKPEIQPVAAAAPVQKFEKGVQVTVPDFLAPKLSLSIIPNPYSRCDFPKGGVPLTIEYDAREAGSRHTQIWLQQRNGKQSLWGQSPGRMPATKTGNWAHDGMKVVLVDVDTTDMLAAQTIHADDCK